MFDYTHDNTECFCKYCGNTSYNEEENMCEFCYDDLNIQYHCILCNKYYNYINIEKICIKYIKSSNIIKKFFKSILF
jgi:hypothetical protein